MDRMFKSLTKAKPLLSLLAVVLFSPAWLFCLYGRRRHCSEYRTHTGSTGRLYSRLFRDRYAGHAGNERVRRIPRGQRIAGKAESLIPGLCRPGRDDLRGPIQAAYHHTGQDVPVPFAYGYGDLLDRDLNASALNTVQMNAAALSCADIRLKEGRLFEAEDYQINAELPILVGSAYMDELAIGDSFSGDYLGVLFTFRVVGILEQGSNYPSHKHVPLDRAIVMLQLWKERPPIRGGNAFSAKAVSRPYQWVYFYR